MSETDMAPASDAFMRTFLGPALRAARAALVDASVVLESQRGTDGLWWRRGLRTLTLNQTDNGLRLRLVAAVDGKTVDLLGMRLDPHAAAEGRVAPDAGCLAWALRMLHEDGAIGLPPSPMAVGAGVAALNGKLGAAPDGKTGARWRDEVTDARAGWALRCSREQRHVLLEFDRHAGAWAMTLDDKSVVDPTQDGVVAALTWLATGDAASLERAKKLRGRDLRVTPEERVLLGGGARVPATSAQLLPDGSRAPVAIDQVRVNITGTRIEPQEGLCVMAVPPELRLHPRDLDRRPDDRRKLWKIGCYASLFESGHALVELPVRDDRTHPIPADERAKKLAEWLLKQLCPCCGEPLRHLNMHQEPDAFPARIPADEDETTDEVEDTETDGQDIAASVPNTPLPAFISDVIDALAKHSSLKHRPLASLNALDYEHRGRTLRLERRAASWHAMLGLGGGVRVEGPATLRAAVAALAFLEDGDYAHLATIRDCAASDPVPQEDPTSDAALDGDAPLPSWTDAIAAALARYSPVRPVNVPNGLLYSNAGRKLAIVREGAAWMLRASIVGSDGGTQKHEPTLRDAIAGLAFIKDGDHAHLATIFDRRSTPVPQEQIMPHVPAPILDALKVDATDAAWRTAGSQFVKLARDPLCALIARHLAPEDESLRNKIAAFLQTEVGTAILASMLSLGLSAVPAAGQTGAVTERLGRELRVRAMADAGDLVAEIVMGPLRQVMSLYLQDPTGAPIAAAPAAPEPPALDAPERVAIGPTRVPAATRR